MPTRALNFENFPQAIAKESAKEDEIVKEIKKDTADIEMSFMRNKAIFDKVVKPTFEKVAEANLVKKKRTQQMTKTDHKAVGKVLQQESKTDKPAVKHTKHAAANEAQVVKEVAEDDDVSARKPVQTNMYDGDEKMRGGATSVSNGYWGAGATDGSYYGVTVPAGLSAGQNFLAKIPGGPEMLVTVPKGVGRGQQIAVKVPPGREESLAFGDAVVHVGAAAAQREGSVRHGVKPDFVKPLGGLGEQGLYQKPSPKMSVVQEIAVEKKAAKSLMAHKKIAAPASTSMKDAKPQQLQQKTAAEKATAKAKMEAKWMSKEEALNMATGAAARPQAAEQGGFQEIEAARRKKEQAKDWKKNTAWAMREVAKQNRHLHDSTHISHDDRNGYWSEAKAKANSHILTGKTQILAFGDAVKHADISAQQREGSVRHGVKPDFVKPLGSLGSTGLAQKSSTPLAVSQEVAREKLQAFEREHAKLAANNAAKAAERQASKTARKAARTAISSKVAGKATWTTDDEDVLDKEENVFSTSEHAVDELEHKMLQKVARENAQRLREEAASGKLKGLPQVEIYLNMYYITYMYICIYISVSIYLYV